MPAASPGRSESCYHFGIHHGYRTLNGFRRDQWLIALEVNNDLSFGDRRRHFGDSICAALVVRVDVNIASNPADSTASTIR